MKKPGRGRGRPIKIVSPAGAEFFKVFLPQTSSHQLRIPPNFIKNLNDDIPGKMMLKHTSGKVWQVDVEKTIDGVFLKNGWQNFVSYHRLQVGEFLVFKYDGNYSFDVKIFGTNGCKRETLAAEKIATSVKIEEDTIEGELEAQQACQKRARLPRENVSLSNVGSGLSADNCKKFQNEDPVDAHDPYFILSSAGAHLAQVTIPRGVIRRHDPHLEPEMVLRTANGKEWPVRSIVLKSGQTILSKGWRAFRRDNNVGPKDSLKFTFETGRSSKTIHVEILRAMTDTYSFRKRHKLNM